MSMPSRSANLKKALVELLGQRLSTATIFFHSAVAERMGVSVTDAKCRSILHQLGSMSAGDLAERLGLTTGAVTGVIDRLVSARLARRVSDPKDRRRVVVELVANAKRDRELGELFRPLGKRMTELALGYDERDQGVIMEFLHGACEILEEETIRLRSTTTS
jgi:DNA-binding MarR family transcriptional regulator